MGSKRLYRGSTRVCQALCTHPFSLDSNLAIWLRFYLSSHAQSSLPFRIAQASVPLSPQFWLSLPCAPITKSLLFRHAL